MSVENPTPEGRAKNRRCIVCGIGPRELPDRESRSMARKVCRPCHGKRLLGDLRRIVALHNEENKGG